MSSMASTKSSQYIFTSCVDEASSNLITRIQLELVSFTLTLTLQNGSTHSITDPGEVQSILDRAREFNQSRTKNASAADECTNANTVTRADNAIIEIKLDPVNSVNTFCIPA